MEKSSNLPAEAISTGEVPQRRWRQWSRRREKVLITGISGRLGQELARHLHRDWHVIGMDRRRISTLPPDVEFHRVDIRRRKAEDIFRCNRIDALVHLNIMHNPRQSSAEHHDFNIIGTQKIFDLCHQHGVRKIVLLSSANVYGPDPANNQFLTEEAPLMAGQKLGFMRDLIGVDMYASSFFWRHPQIETVILRPVHLVGAVRNAPSNFLRLKTVPTVLGYDPMLQLLHIEDLIQAIMLSLKPGLRGIYNIAGPGELPLSELLGALGRRRVPVPEPVARALFGAMWRARVSSFPIEELEYIKHICMVDDSRAREHLRYRPRMTLQQTLEAIR